eukprot:g6524.t1
MDLPHSSDLDAQRRFEDAEYEERLRNTESGLSYSVLPDNVQAPRRTLRDGDVVVKSSQQSRGVYTVPANRIVFSNYAKQEDGIPPPRHLLLRNTGSRCQPVVVTRCMTPRFRISGPSTVSSPFQIFLTPGSTFSYTVDFAPPQDDDPQSELWDNFQDVVLVYTRFYVLRVLLTAVKQGHNARRESFYPQLTALSPPPKPSEDLFCYIENQGRIHLERNTTTKGEYNSDADEEGNCIDYANHAEDELERTIISRSSQFPGEEIREPPVPPPAREEISLNSTSPTRVYRVDDKESAQNLLKSMRSRRASQQSIVSGHLSSSIDIGSLSAVELNAFQERVLLKGKKKSPTLKEREDAKKAKERKEELDFYKRHIEAQEKDFSWKRRARSRKAQERERRSRSPKARATGTSTATSYENEDVMSSESDDSENWETGRHNMEEQTRLPDSSDSSSTTDSKANSNGWRNAAIRGSMHDFLAAHGLLKHKEVFRKNGIDSLALLAILTPADVAELGIKNPSRQRRLLEVSGELREWLQENESDDENYANEAEQESELAFYRNLVAEDRLKRLVNPNPEPNGRDVLEDTDFASAVGVATIQREQTKKNRFRLFASDQREGKKVTKSSVTIKSKKKRNDRKEKMKDIMMKPGQRIRYLRTKERAMPRHRRFGPRGRRLGPRPLMRRAFFGPPRPHFRRGPRVLRPGAVVGAAAAGAAGAALYCAATSSAQPVYAQAPVAQPVLQNYQVVVPANAVPTANGLQFQIQTPTGIKTVLAPAGSMIGQTVIVVA